MSGSRPLTTLLSGLVLVSLSCGVIAEFPRPAARSAAGPTAGSAGTWRSGETGTSYEAVRESIGRLHSGLLPSDISHVARILVDESERAGLSPALVLAVIYVESSGYNFAKSHKGALGLMQLRPDTAAWVAGRIGLPWEGPMMLFDAGTNVRLGIIYLSELVHRYGSVRTALAAYNWGPTRISKILRKGRPVPVVYSDRVFEVYGAGRNREV